MYLRGDLRIQRLRLHRRHRMLRQFLHQYDDQHDALSKLFQRLRPPRNLWPLRMYLWTRFIDEWPCLYGCRQLLLNRLRKYKH